MARGNTSAKETYAARQKRLEEERRRQRAQERKRKQVIAGVVVAALIVAGVAGYFIVANLTKSKTGAQATPKNVTSSYAVPVGQSTAPVTMDLYQDFQCPVCQAFEKASGAAYEAQIANGTAKVNYHLLNFIDANQGGGDTYSTRAAQVALCVNDVEPAQFVKTQNTLFANQPKEGSAATNTSTDTMLGWLQAAGIDTSQVSSCAKSDSYTNWINSGTTNAQQELAKQGRQLATPTILINGKYVAASGTQLLDPNWITQQITDAAAAAKK